MKFEEWKTKLTSQDRNDRYDAADCIPEADPDQIIPLLLQALHDEDEMVRVAALETLGFLPDERVRRALRAHYEKETNPLAKEFALESLGKVGDVEDFIYILNLSKQVENSRGTISSFLGVQQGMSYLITSIIVEILEEKEDLGRSTANLYREALENFIKNLKEVENAFKARLDLDKEKGWNIEGLEKTVSLIRGLFQGLPEKQKEEGEDNETESDPPSQN